MVCICSLFMNEENASGQFGVKYLNKCNKIREKTKIATWEAFYYKTTVIEYSVAQKKRSIAWVITKAVQHKNYEFFTLPGFYGAVVLAAREKEKRDSVSPKSRLFRRGAARKLWWL